MKSNIKIKSEDMLKLIRYAFLRLDGAWFMTSAEVVGLETATEIDIKTWEVFSERLGKKIASVANFNGKVSQDLLELMKIFHVIMNMNAEVQVENENTVIHRVLDCEVWKMVQKVWEKDQIPCHKVTLASIKGLLEGAFPEQQFMLNHQKKIPLGDSCCEVKISVKTS